MKVKFILLGVIAISMIAFSACEKELSSLHNKNSRNLLHVSNARLHDELSNPDDQEDERMNDNLFMLANAVASFANDLTLINKLYTEAEYADGNVLYSTLVNLDSSFKTKLNAFLGENYFSDFPVGYDCLTHIDNDMVYKNRDYTPGVSVPNLSTCDKTQLPFVCIGAEIANDDRIIAYKVTINGIESTYLTEEQAIVSSNPVIIINSAATFEETVSDNSTWTLPDSVSPLGDTTWIQLDFRTWKVKAGYRYEGKGNTDVRHLVSFFETSNMTWQQGPGYGRNRIAKRILGQVSPSEVAASHEFLGYYSIAAPIDTFDQVWNRMYLTVYEYDWYTYPKSISVCNNSVVHNPRMKYANEWYVNSICGFDYLHWFPVADSLSAPVGVNNSKFTCTFCRTH